ncbi:hypothetical protein BJY01DRAFT_259927 [Aspergillus pseudoustus]|uniref:Fungal-specific transcription factor domain-containing protein n=1 Tax=Aspergillus pseudoustus TaxID=1810923 RepID=A0ABR4IZW1_9EURO
MAPQGQEKQFIFVGGPALTAKGSGIRSKVVQDGMRERRLARQKIALDEMDRLIQERRTSSPPHCSCRRQAIPASALSQSPARNQPIRGERCMFCTSCLRRLDNFARSSVHGPAIGLPEPMIPINERTSKLKVREIFSFATRFIFPNLRILGQPDLFQTWAFPFEDDELKFFTFLWSSRYHEDVLRLTYGAPADPARLKEQLALKGQTLRALRKQVRSYTCQEPIDGIIRCMLVLGVNEKPSERIYREPSPFAPVFTGLHGLEVYGSRDYSPIHWKVMHELLQKHGGIKALNLFALAWQVSIADLTNAAHTIRKPLYPLVDVYGQELELDPPLLLFKQHLSGNSNAEFLKPGSGFRELLFMKPSVQKELVRVFCNIGELSHVMESLSTQPIDPQLLDILADSRDLAHHQLFSLPTEHDPAHQILQITDRKPTRDTHGRSLNIYLVCYLSTLLYATHVTFPVPRSILVRQRLLGWLCPRLLQLALPGRGLPSPLVLWCTSVALIALDKEEPFDGVLKLFQRLCRGLQVTSLEELLPILRWFAWVDSAVRHHYTTLETYFLSLNEDDTHKTKC